MKQERRRRLAIWSKKEVEDWMETNRRIKEYCEKHKITPEEFLRNFLESRRKDVQDTHIHHAVDRHAGRG